MMIKSVAVCALVVLLTACGGLPADFDELSLDRKLAAYGHHRSSSGKPHRARRGIAAHKGAAATQLLTIVQSRGATVIPRTEALVILNHIHLVECALDKHTTFSAIDRILQDGTTPFSQGSAAIYLRQAILETPNLHPPCIAGAAGDIASGLR